MTINRFYYIDKPIGLTSFDVLRQMRKKLNMKKMWHTGTLDPLATGGLLVAVWNYTKLIPYFEKDSKEYIFTVELNWVTPSFDSETPVEYISKELQQKFKKELTQEKIEETLKQNFFWEIQQVPPKYSALKINGKKALEKVRNWEEFEMKIRNTTIFEIEVLEFNYPQVTIRAKVAAGTYIRSIAFDLWEIIGTGWYVSFLRRTKIDELKVEDAQNLDEFDETKYFDDKKLFWDEKFTTLPDYVLVKLNNGLPVNYPEFNKPDGEYFVENKEGITNIVSYQSPILKAKRKI